MFQPFWRKVVVAGCVSLLTLTVATWSPLTGQERKAEKPKVAKKEARGRLPAYYREVVTEEQRTKIYEVQQKYAAQIEDLQSQLAALRQKQDAEIAALLSKEQLDKVTALKSEADSKRKKRGEPKKTDAAKTQAAKTPAN